jgi:hypothetical protein
MELTGKTEWEKEMSNVSTAKVEDTILRLKNKIQES